MIALLAPLAGFGLMVGSFLNVVIHRVPRGGSLVFPASSCPLCGAAIQARDNIPVLSWLALRGRCRTCQARIAVRYPLIEILGAVAFGTVAWRFGPDVLAGAGAASTSAAVIVLGAFLYFAAISVVLAAIDLDVHRLPDAVVLPAYPVGALLLGFADLLRGDPVAFASAAFWSGAAVLLYLLLAIVKPNGMGMGDVKLAGVLGLFLGQLGAAQALVGISAGFALGGLFGVVLLASNRALGSTGIPFGPWMLSGAWLGVLAGEPLAQAYLHLAGLA